MRALADAVNKQLAHIMYARDKNPREITREASEDMYNELKRAWKEFRRRGLSVFLKFALTMTAYASETSTGANGFEIGFV
jgi:hypothetical protein